jgi:hypothetical protein
MRSAMFPRILGALTAAYGAYTLMRPHSLVRAAGLEPGDRPISQSGRRLGRGIGARDLVSGVSMLLAPQGAPLRAAVTGRVACDLADTIGFGLAVPRRYRTKVIAVAGGWGLLCAASFPAAGRTR